MPISIDTLNSAALMNKLTHKWKHMRESQEGRRRKRKKKINKKVDTSKAPTKARYEM